MKRKTVLSLKKKQALAGYIFISALILGVILVFIPSIIKTVQFSLNEINITGEGYTMSYKGIEYYVAALTEDANFLPMLRKSLTSLVVDMLVILVFSLFISSLLNQKFKGRVIARIIFFIPVILSTGVIVEADSSILGFIENTAVDMGNTVDLSEFMQFTELLTSLNFSDTLIEIIVGAVSGIYDVVCASGIQIFILLAGLQEISPSLYEAASVEGCSGWESFWKITFPMISPQIAVAVIYTIVDACAQNSTLFTYMHEVAFNRNQFGLSTAMSIIYLICLGVIIAIVFFILAKFIKHQSQNDGII
ncbi:MAG: sugar ABC transporter permease [Clostridia bacterium]|nr:sugar ABC transporter permease [Clostridia bacterium]